MQKRLHVYYSGDVQGVGFRFTAQYIGRGLNLKGWVKNLSDGGVEVVAEGEEELLKEFLERIKAEMNPYISSQKISWEGSSGEFRDFGIKF